MNDLKTILLCALVNFRKWMVNPRIYTLAAVTVGFLSWHSAGLSQLSAAVGIDVTPWVFPNLLTTSVMIAVFACFIMLLFCDAPFADSHTPFLIIRTGRRNWVIGQLLYIILAAFIYTVFFLIMSVVVLLPNVQWDTGWGKILKTIAANPSIGDNYGIKLTVFVHPLIVDIFSPIEATIISFGLFWLTSVFIGVLILCGNVITGKAGGLVMAGVFLCISFFTEYLGPLTFGGYWIRYLSPINWSSMCCLDWTGMGEWVPTSHAVISLLLAIVFMSIVSTLVFCKKDMDIQKRG
ncbi:MAG: hypothetical protein GX094_08540 [Clostridiales bacterium]|nr:hypothetical protein [Clostridiales bacterium]